MSCCPVIPQFKFLLSFTADMNRGASYDYLQDEGMFGCCLTHRAWKGLR